MQKTTKDLLNRLKELRPSVHGISYSYETNWGTNKLEEVYFLDLPTPIKCTSEKELRNKIKECIASTESELGFRYPHSTKRLNLNADGLSLDKED